MWSKTLLDASFRGLTFDCQSVEDQFEKRFAEHVYPFVPGADIEDLGRGSRHISVQAIFSGDNYEDQLKAFIKQLEIPGAGEFVHPVFGSMPNAQVANGSIHHESDNVDQATVSFDLVESTAGNPFFAQQTAVQSAEAAMQQSQSARDASANSLSGLISQLKALNPISQLTQLRQQMLGPIMQLKAEAGGVITAGLDVVNYPLSWASDLTSLAGSVTNVSAFSPSTILADYKLAVTRLTDVLSNGSTAVVINPANPSQASAIQAASVHAQIERASSIADAAAAVLASESITPTLIPTEIEAVTNTARTEIENAIAMIMASYPADSAWLLCEPLKNTALSLQTAAESIIVTKPPLINRTVITAMPLKFLAFLWYGDHARSDELQRMNTLSNPNFLTAGQALLAYAN